MKKMCKFYVAVLMFFVAFGATPGFAQPIIDVTPDSLNFILVEGDSSTAQLIIRNIGTTTLDFEINNEFLSSAGISGNAPESFEVLNSEKVLNPYSNIEQFITNNTSKDLINSNLFSTETSSVEGGRMFGATGSQIVEIDLNSGNLINSFNAPASISEGPTGLAFSGTKLYFTDSYTTYDIFVVDPSNGATLNSYPAPSTSIDALAYVDNKLYALDYGASLIYELNPEDGTVLRTINPPVPVGGGIDGGSGRLFASYFDIMVYELSLTDGSIINSFVPVNPVLGLGITNNYIYTSIPGGGIDKYDINTGAYLGNISPLSFAALAGGGEYWLSEAQSSGSVLPGDSVSIDVNVRTSFLNGGDYNAMIFINSNDPIFAQDTVHVHLTVIGAPIIVLSHDSLDFPLTYIGFQDSQTLRISNDGSDLLEVFGITSDNAHFTVLDSTVFNVAQGGYKDIAVQFAPTVVGIETGTLNISSSDSTKPNVFVQISGNGLFQPDIFVSPDSLSDSLFTGETAVETLTIENLGGSDLIVDLTANIDFSKNSTLLETMQSNLLQRLIDNNEVNQDMLNSESTTLEKQSNISKLDESSQTASVASGVYTGDFLSFGISDYGEIMPFQFPIGNEHWQEGTYLSGYTVAYRVSGVDNIAIVGFDHRSRILPVSYTELINNASEVIVEVVTKTDNNLLFITRTFRFSRNDKFINIDTKIENISGSLVTDVVFKSYADWDTDGEFYGNWDYDLSRNMVYSWMTNYTAIASSRVPELMDIDGWGDYGIRDTYIDNPTGPVFSKDGLAIIHLELGDIVSGSFTQLQMVYGAGSSLADLESVMDRGISFAHWISLEPSSAIVPAGTSYDFDIIFDATGLNGGDYFADIIVNSNDLDEPELIVPAYLHVTGAPNLVVSADSLEFGSLFIGATRVNTIVIENNGTDQLLISGIVSNHSDFQPDITNITLNPGENRVVTITFIPTTATLISGTLTLTSNDPGQPIETVYLSGEGLIPPDISVSPDFLDDSLFTNEITIDTLTINNVGGSDLYFDISISAFDSTSTSTTLYTLPEINLSANSLAIDSSISNEMVLKNTTVKPLSAALTDLSGITIGLFSSSGNYSIIISDLVARGATVFYVWSPITTTVLDSLDVLAIDDMVLALSTTEIDIIRTWTQAGNGLLLQGDDNGSMAKLNNLLVGTGISESFIGTYSEGIFTDILPHITTTGVSSIDGSGYGASCTVVSPAQTIIFDNDARPHAAISQFGLGRVFAVGNEFSSDYNFSVGDARLFANQVFDWLASVSDFLSVEPASGTVAAGSSLDIAVTVDATNLNGGNYYADVVVSSNDPDEPELRTPAHLFVTGVPNIATTPDSIDFGPLFIGASIIDTILVTNIGTDLLIVSGVNSNNSNFLTDAISFTLNPGQNIEIPVTFTPIISGTIDGLLTFTSDDPDQPEHSVFLSGYGLIPPEISVLPDSLDESLAIGDSSMQVLTIFNNGGSDLNWELSTEYADITTSIISSPIFSSDENILPIKDSISEVTLEKLPESSIYTFDESSITSSPSSPANSVELEEILDKLNTGFENVTNSIPNKYDFRDGVTGYSISDGGNDMYDGGNALSTNFGGSIIYSDNVINGSSLLGPSGRYFTRKYPGLFVMAADAENLTYFQISGKLGADGGGSADGSILETEFNGIKYLGFVKRVFNTWDPSVNHLIIIEYDSLANHEFSTYTNDDYHRIFNLNNVNRIITFCMLEPVATI